MGLIIIAMLDMKAGSIWLLAALLVVSFCLARAEVVHPDQEIGEHRDSKVLPIFQVVKFPNDVCTGSSRNGTCYTSEECSTKGGTNDGSCASGFGVCCVFSLSCGDTSSENQTYLVQSSTTSLTSPCTYTICKCSTTICRIRFDFSTFVLASAVAGTTVAATEAASTTNGAAVGDCMTDQFHISGSTSGSPTICGTNGGYHMILDASDSCHKVNFNIGALTTTTRKWDIRITQYACGDYDSAGPPNCLQYYTATAGNIQNFGWPTTAATVTAGVTHLSNQKYDICVRRGAGYCFICYSAAIDPAAAAAAAINQASFGLSVGTIADAAGANQDTDCTADFLVIPYGNTKDIAAITTPEDQDPAVRHHRYCGRFLASIDDTIASATICTRRAPFTVGVNIDSNEQTGADGTEMAQTNEASLFPGGIVGFQLTYFQVAC